MRDALKPRLTELGMREVLFLACMYAALGFVKLAAWINGGTATLEIERPKGKA